MIAQSAIFDVNGNPLCVNNTGYSVWARVAQTANLTQGTLRINAYSASAGQTGTGLSVSVLQTTATYQEERFHCPSLVAHHFGVCGPVRSLRTLAAQAVSGIKHFEHRRAVSGTGYGKMLSYSHLEQWLDMLLYTYKQIALDFQLTAHNEYYVRRTVAGGCLAPGQTVTLCNALKRSGEAGVGRIL